MNANTESKSVTIALSDLPPVVLDLGDTWGRIARAYWHDGEVECQAIRRARIVVWEHDDGRRVVQGVYTTQWRGERDITAGYIVRAEGYPHDLVGAIRRVAEEIGMPELAGDCISDLPPQPVDRFAPPAPSPA